MLYAGRFLEASMLCKLLNVPFHPLGIYGVYIRLPMLVTLGAANDPH